jgi:hypothetical protein
MRKDLAYKNPGSKQLGPVSPKTGPSLKKDL